jgi:hypothetical protein
MQLFKKQTNKAITIDLGTISRAGGTATKVTLGQEDFQGQPLMGVSVQSPIINAKGKVFKFRSAYYKNMLGAYAIENEATGKFGTNVQPAFATKSIKNYNVEELSENIMSSENNGKIVDFEWKVTDAAGKVVAEIVYNEVTKAFEKRIYDSPIYKERMNNRGEEFSLTRSDGTTSMVGVETDDKGTFKFSFDRYTYVAPGFVSLFIGQKVTDSGTLLENTKGVYVVVTDEESYGAKRITPQKSSAKLGVASMFDKVILHPEFGVAKPEHVNKAGLVEGTLGISVIPSKIKIFDNNGDAVAIIGEAYKLEDFKPTRRRGSTLSDEEADIKSNIKNDLKQTLPEVETEEVEDDDMF